MSRKYTISDLRDIAESRGGRCLSDNYMGMHEKHQWRCSRGHEWLAVFNSIRRGNWCPACARTNAGLAIAKRKKSPHTLSDLKNHARKLNGSCQAVEYTGVLSTYRWKCEKGHEWDATWHRVRLGNWCPTCSRAKSADEQRGDIEIVRSLAEERGGTCLSKDADYITVHSRLKFECAAGHRFSMNSNSVQQGHWCPYCSSGRGERMCRSAFEQLFGHPFPRKKPQWLVNERGNRMELDGYCKSLNLAFEHHGKQHYSSGTMFVPDDKALADRISADRHKRTLCAANGVTLIEIPEIGSLTPLERLKDEIKKQCSDHSYPLPYNFDSVVLNLGDSFVHQGMGEMHELAAARGGKCLSRAFKGYHEPLRWECDVGHRWGASPASIKHNKSWCPTCGGRPSYTIDDLKELARSKGGECLSSRYVNAHTRYRWKCKLGHEWKANASNVRTGTWCPSCSGRLRLSLQSAQEIAKKTGGRCLAHEYVNNNTRMLWECSEGHQWLATYGNVQQGKWCPECYEIRRSSK